MGKGNLIGEGRTAEIFQWEENKVLKLYRKGIPKEEAEREYEITLNVYNKCKLAPKVYEMIETDDRSGIIYEKINGKTMLSIIGAKPWNIKKEAERFAELHKSIQKEVDFELPTYKSKLKENISYTDLLSSEIKTKLYKYIDELPEDNKLCHGDFHPDNILVTKDKQIVIDWMTATKGNPLADVARTSIMLKFAVVPGKPWIVRKIIDVVRNKLYLEYLKHYLKISGTDIKEIEAWELPVAAARLIEWLPESEKKTLVNFIDTRMSNLSN